MVKRLSLPFFLVILLTFSAADAYEWTFLNTTRIGASEFIDSHPDYNGKDVVIMILDTGVDMGVEGLKELPGGGVKVIDVQDFSGEGDVTLEEAEVSWQSDEPYLKHSSGVKLYGFTKLPHHPSDSLYYMGVLKEERFKNSVIPDVNNNGKENDVFGAAVFESDEGWLAYVDLDGDGNLDDEMALFNYKDKLQSFQFKGRDTKERRNLANFGLNIFPDEKRINFHYDGAAHGTHVAGIAAGYRINGQEDLNGIAPGAKIISLKIGDCRLAGGATTTGSMLEAYEYGVAFAKDYDGPVVFNMSFGIGSEIEGLADMDLMLDDMLRENESLLFCTSAGNEGPGVSTVGLPAAAKRVLSVGAMLPKTFARDVYGVQIERDLIFSFSSRGGERNKPDALAPGAAASTVPPFSTRDVMGGTSMASPQAAGAVALLMSAARHSDPPLPINGALLKKAIKNAAQPLKGYMALEQGSGVINVPKAFEFYKRYIERDDHKSVILFDANTESPIYASGSGETAYWRFGSYFPDERDPQRFYINPVFPEDFDADDEQAFYRAFEMETTVPWININKSNVYIKGSHPATVDVHYDQSLTNKPGIYNGRIIGYRKGGLFGGNDPSDREFDLMCTVIVPHTFNAGNHYRWQSGEIGLDNGELRRIFFDVPVQASAVTIELEPVNGKYSRVSAVLFDPKGRETEYRTAIDDERTEKRTIRLHTDDLKAGTYEWVLSASMRNTERSYVRTSIAFSGLEISPQTVTSVKVRNGQDAQGSFDVINQYNDRNRADVNGKLYGFQRIKYIDDNSDNYEYTFTVSEKCDKVVFDLELSAEVYNYFTDFAVNIKNFEGNVLTADGLTYRKKSITFIPPASGSYILQLIPAFAGHEPRRWNARLTESYYLFNEIPISSGQYNFYPDVKKTVDFNISETLPVAPDGFYVFGEIWLESRDVRAFRTTLPVELFTNLND